MATTGFPFTRHTYVVRVILMSRVVYFHSYCGVTLDKGAQKSNWSQRPLAQKMLAYAASDVAYLASLQEQLSDQLSACGRLGWHQEQCAAQVAKCAGGFNKDPRRDAGELWRVKGYEALKLQGMRRVLRYCPCPTFEP